jgi:thymidylate synthase ThyX
MTTTAKIEPYIIADSRNIVTGDRLTTVVFPRFWKLLQAELRTHRLFSQSHYSSRAIPIQRVIEQVETDPYIPIFTGFAKGMGGTELEISVQEQAVAEVMQHRMEAVESVSRLVNMGLAKQNANRYLEPWMHGGCIVTGDQHAWKHFFSLRCAEGVQPDMKRDATKVRDLYEANMPQLLELGQWHLPFYSRDIRHLSLDERLHVCTARCARISFNNFDGDFEYEKDKRLHDRLILEQHMTPLEHCAFAAVGRYNNTTGFQSYRYIVESGCLKDTVTHHCISFQGLGNK